MSRWFSLLKWLGRFYPMAKRGLYRFHGGIFPTYHKSLSSRHALHQTFIPSELVLPLQQHLGVATEPMVKVGDYVKKNQLIADTQEGLSAPIHAPTSGHIIAIEPRTLPHASGLQGMCIVLKTDGKHETLTNTLQVTDTVPDDPTALKDLIYRAGIVGLGGAGFPTFAKLPNTKGKIHTLLVNGAECEPFITCDDVLMQTQPEDIIQGTLLVAKALGCEKILCGIEDNKPEAIRSMKQAAQNTFFEVVEVPTVYPMGGQKQLTQELLGFEIPAHAHSVDIGILMMNVATFAAIYHAVTFGTPLTSRLVTVSGLGLEQPYNIEALLGTSFSELVALAKPKIPVDYALVQGGPMMGVKMASNEVPVVKITNCVLANPPEPTQEIMPCIRCGECMDACPVNLLPQQMYWHARSHEFDKVEQLKVFDCIECGCCSFVCPSHIPLVQYYRYAKSEIKQLKQEATAAEIAKQRHEAKLAREARQKEEREARIKAKKAEVKQKAAASATTKDSSPNASSASASNPASAAAAAKAAAARRKASETATTKEGSVTQVKPMSAREKAIAAAQKRAQASQSKVSGASHPAELANKPPTDVTPTDATPTDERGDKRTKEKQAAMAAAKRTARNQTPQASEGASTTKTDKREAAMAAAKKRAQARKKTSETEAEPSSDNNRSTASNTVQTDAAQPQETMSPKTSDSEAFSARSSSDDAKANARKAAMAAAKKRAAARKSETATDNKEKTSS